jgi:hypothetical protein
MAFKDNLLTSVLEVKRDAYKEIPPGLSGLVIRRMCLEVKIWGRLSLAG